MFEYFASRIKLTLLIALFLSPIFAAQWNRQLDEWFKQNQRYEAAPHFVAAMDSSNSIDVKN